MAQPNLNRQWIFEHEENYEVLHRADAGSPHGVEARDAMPCAAVVAAQVARLDGQIGEYYGKGA